MRVTIGVAAPTSAAAATSTALVISTDGLVKRFSDVDAVAGIE
jgi:hypothetical protein